MIPISKPTKPNLPKLNLNFVKEPKVSPPLANKKKEKLLRQRPKEKKGAGNTYLQRAPSS